ncbi:MAG: hypothetical protein MUO88_12110 [Desulfobacterales bacterium]|nr:hypothetical protein [Desulfobacterales bacterium]
MGFKEQIKKFYLEHAPGATVEENLLKAPCPFCSSGETEKPKLKECPRSDIDFSGIIPKISGQPLIFIPISS